MSRDRFAGVVRVVFLLAAALLAGPAAAQAPGRPAFGVAGTDSASVHRFLHTLQGAVRAGRTESVVALAHYPLRAWADGRTLRVRGPAELRSVYGRVFTPELRRSILAARMDRLFANAQGVMFDHGRVWFAPTEQGLRIITINGPPGPGNRFDPSTVSVGDTVLGLRVRRMEAGPVAPGSGWEGEMEFSGEITLSGRYRLDGDAGEPTTLCFFPDAASARRLPVFDHETRISWLCFENQAQARRMLGTAGRARIVVDRYHYRFVSSDVINEARLVRVLR